MKPELILCIGAPGSGKSTWSKQFVKENKDYIRICRDDMRTMFKQVQMLPWEMESVLTDIVQGMVKTAVKNDIPVVLDQTNCKLKYIYCWETYDVQLKIFNEPLDVLIERNNKRTTDKVPEEVVTGMYKSLQAMLEQNLLEDYVKI